MTTPSAVHRSVRTGFTIVEAVAAMVVVSLMLVAALQAVGASALAQRSTSDRSRGHLLAQQLMDEILQQGYEEKDLMLGSFGPELNELLPAYREKYDDVDDYHSWIASPPEARNGTVMDELTGWSRSVQVEWVHPLSPNQVVGYDSHLKRITVNVTHNGLPVGELTALRSAGWHQPFDDGDDGSELTVLVQALPEWGFAPLYTTFNGGASFNGVLIDPMLLTWSWNFGDGNTGIGNPVLHTYLNDGVYTATVVASALDGKSGSASVTITVNDD